MPPSHRSGWTIGFLFQVWLVLVLFFSESSFAQLSPGKLAQGHAHLEGLDNCAKCHSNKVRSTADPMLCRDCHDAIDIRMKDGKGLHGKPEFNQCGKCHPDHLGRSFNLVTWKTLGGTREQFDHTKTGYTLEGAHTKVKCTDCHQSKNLRDPAILKGSAEMQKRTFLGLGTECLACHKDIHGKLFPQKKCLDCHNMEKWKPAKGFDHNQDTRYDLRGKHAGLECMKCHTKGDPWKWPVQQKLRDHGCAACHKDVHKGKFGRDCAKCHQEEGFKKIKVTGFDHSKTKFPLEGKHAEVNCNQCHKSSNTWVLKQFQKCIDCHNNFHNKEFTKTQRPERCEDCHTVQGFLPANYGVREHNQTDFKLADAHLAIPCAACHTTTVNVQNEVVKRKFKFTSLDCIACHDDPHQKQVDKYKAKLGCQSCHSGATWREIRFDHAQTGYKLTGRHKRVGCVDCHTDGFAFKLRSGNHVQIPDFDKRKTQCFECHEDKHFGQFKEKDEKTARTVVRCDKCHTTTDWFAEGFDHNKHSKFKLDGAHARARCEACHSTQKALGKTFVRYKPIGTDCRTCHADSLRFR